MDTWLIWQILAKTKSKDYSYFPFKRPHQITIFHSLIPGSLDILTWWFADTVFRIRSRDIAADFMLSGFVETTKLQRKSLPELFKGSCFLLFCHFYYFLSFMKKHPLVSPDLSGCSLLVGRSRDCSHCVSHRLCQSHLCCSQMWSYLWEINVPPSVRVRQSQWSRLFYRHSSPPSYTVESTWWWCKFKWKPDHEPPVGKYNERDPKESSHCDPGTKDWSCSLQGVSSGYLRSLKVHEKVSRKGF